ncbi:phosphatidylserine/phosphatidylglycerophosphate/cardiolipin synthase family protein [Geobacter sp. DSM 9736]|uniref:phospholipase D-like domain-containing protein n=1 Tax=Geobacter sp. DSM 9736 TaxID=1277350 RepID=UPI000B503D11|nr:phospholipase D-like domain-containing protein [Geobacter sp. DSM 9736]SNB46846.1 cardiolipin synthase [Geobacter sp. DSM 9736]
MSRLRRKRQFRIFRTPRFFRWFRRNTEAACSPQNRVRLFDTGGELFRAMIESFAQARHQILIEFYIIRSDRTGAAFAQALLAAAARGVSVRLLYDYVGCFDTPGYYFRHLEKGGVRCIPFNPPPFRGGLAWFDRRDHRKMVLVDGAVAFLGGINIGDEYAAGEETGEQWRDLGVRIEGPAVSFLQQLFLETWVEERGDTFIPEETALADREAGDASLMVVTGSPHHNRSFIRSAFMMAVAGASETVKVLTPYFVPGPRFLRSLLRAARRGVRVQLVLPEKSDVPLVRLVSRSYYGPLLRAGVEVYERQGTILHAKVMVIDGCWTVIGSANLDLRSFHRNYELNVVVDSHEFGMQVERAIEEDIRRSHRIDLVEHEQRGVLVRLMERLSAPASWFL